MFTAPIPSILFENEVIRRSSTSAASGPAIGLLGADSADTGDFGVTKTMQELHVFCRDSVAAFEKRFEKTRQELSSTITAVQAGYDACKVRLGS